MSQVNLPGYSEEIEGSVYGSLRLFCVQKRKCFPYIIKSPHCDSSGISGSEVNGEITKPGWVTLLCNRRPEIIQRESSEYLLFVRMPLSL